MFSFGSLGVQVARKQLQKQRVVKTAGLWGRLFSSEQNSVCNKVVCSGDGSWQQIPVTWQLYFGKKGSFRFHVNSDKFNKTIGFTGSQSRLLWEKDNGGCVNIHHGQDYQAEAWLIGLSMLFGQHTQYPETYYCGKAGEDVQQVFTSLFHQQKLQLVARTKLKEDHVLQAAIKLDKDIVQGWQFVKRSVRMDTRVQFDEDKPAMDAFLPQHINVLRLGSDHPISLTLQSTQIYEHEKDDISIIPSEQVYPQDTNFGDQTSPVAAIVKGYMISGGAIYVGVNLNGVQGYMMLDSGSHITLIMKTMAKKLGLIGDIGSVKLGIIGGQFVVDLGVLKEFKLGNMSIKGLDIGIVDMGALGTSGPQPMFGLIGAQVFRRMVVELPKADSTKSQELPVIVYDPARYNIEEQIKSKVYWTELMQGLHSPFVQVMVKPVGQTQPFQCTLLLDTGYGGNIMLCTRKLKLRNIDFSQWTGAGTKKITAMGSVEVNNHVIEEVKIGDLILESLEVCTTDIGTGIDGLMGTGFLKGYNMLIDVPNRKMGLIMQGQKNQ